MVQVQINISVRGDDNNTVVVDLLRREDANDAEWEMARNIQDMILGVMEMVRAELPPGEGEIEIEVIPPPPTRNTGGMMNTELAAYQNAIERAKGEIATLNAEQTRLIQDIARLQVALEDARVALESERAARAQREDALERLRRLVRIAVARGFIPFIPQDLREDVE